MNLHDADTWKAFTKDGVPYAEVNRMSER
jgi:hypothetical protein